MGLGWWLGQAWGVAAGALLAAWLWMAWDMWRARKLLVWLRSTELQQAPAMAGLWGELPPHAPLDAPGCSRCSRATSGSGHLCGLAGQSQWRGAARCTGPHRMVQPDGGQQFGFDAERDVLQSIGNLVRDPAFSAYFARRTLRSRC
jgi:two-component system phosphate regulon sensor histidine kinase PhoR